MNPELTTEDWDRYRGNNCADMPPVKVVCGGSVSFARHLGKPLGPELWKDLLHRLCINGLCIYGPMDLQWTIGWGEGHCIVQLDGDGLVRDIEFNPYRRFRS